MSNKKGKANPRFKDRTGETHYSDQGLLMTIITYRNKKDCDVQFEDGTIIRNRQYSGIVRGKVRNPYHPSVFGVGYMGQGEFSHVTHPIHHRRWSHMIRRCHCPIYLSRFPTYKDCSLIKEWECFQVFAKWFDENWKPHMDSTWHLDKDLLVEGNKQYSPETCVIIPNIVNQALTKGQSKRGKYPMGVTHNHGKYDVSLNGEYIGKRDTPEEGFALFKEVKEAWMKELSIIYKGLMSPLACEALNKWTVSIKD